MMTQTKYHTMYSSITNTNNEMKETDPTKDEGCEFLCVPHTKIHTTMRKWVPLPSEMQNDLNRPLLPSEMTRALHEMQLTSPHTIAAADTQPTAIILIGAAGSGKSSILPRLPSYLPGHDISNFFLLDGDYLRACHGGFRRSCGEAGVGYLGSLAVVRPHIKAAKAALLERAIRERRNVLIPTPQYSDMYVEIMTAASYKVHIIGIYADCDVVMTRGVKRAEEMGREYQGTVEKWKRVSRDMFH